MSPVTDWKEPILRSGFNIVNPEVPLTNGKFRHKVRGYPRRWGYVCGRSVHSTLRSLLHVVKRPVVEGLTNCFRCEKDFPGSWRQSISLLLLLLPVPNYPPEGHSSQSLLLSRLRNGQGSRPTSTTPDWTLEFGRSPPVWSHVIPVGGGPRFRPCVWWLFWGLSRGSCFFFIK